MGVESIRSIDALSGLLARVSVGDVKHEPAYWRVAHLDK